MPRFTAAFENTPAELVVRDTSFSPAREVVRMLKSDLHQPGAGGSGALSTLDSVIIREIEKPFGTPYGNETEMGFDLIFVVSAPGGGAAKEVGKFVLKGVTLGDAVLYMEPFLGYLGTDPFPQRVAGHAAKQSDYPGDMYAPIIVLRGDDGGVEYNVCGAVCCDILTYNHGFHFRSIVEDIGGTPTVMEFQARSVAGTAWFTIPAGQTRVYTIAFRINDRTDTDVGPSPYECQEWIWTLRGYQQYFQGRYGKPDYRSMGGWDGRPCLSISMVGTTSSGNPRGWSFGRDPEASAGYDPSITLATDQVPAGFARVMYFAMAGSYFVHPQYTYAYNFMTGIDSLNSNATGSLPHMRLVNDAGMTLGYWWGRSAQPNNVGTGGWDTFGTPPFWQMDPSDASLVALGWAELDRALNAHARMIGLDAYGFDKPGDAVRWLKMLKARAPATYFVTEQLLPDYLHVLAPTYFIEASIDDEDFNLSRSLHVANYVCPGSECFVQGNEPFTPARVITLAKFGYSPIGGYTFFDPGDVAGVRAEERWPDVGECAVHPHTKALGLRVSRTQLGGGR